MTKEVFKYKVNKDSKIGKVYAYARGYYSGTEAVATIVIPGFMVEPFKDIIEKEEFFAGELDGKHSEVYTTNTVTEMTVEEYLKEVSEENVNNISDVVIEGLSIMTGEHLELMPYDTTWRELESLNEQLNEYKAVKETLVVNEEHQKLLLDLLGENLIKGTQISYYKNKHPITDNVLAEVDFKLI